MVSGGDNDICSHSEGPSRDRRSSPYHCAMSDASSSCPSPPAKWVTPCRRLSGLASLSWCQPLLVDWCRVIRGWFTIFREVEVGGLVEISMLVKKALSKWPKSCNHHTTPPLVTNTCAHELASPRSLSSYRCNREHKQEQERTQLNCRWMSILNSWGLTNCNYGKTVSYRLI
jgi:hypothetical protein